MRVRKRQLIFGLVCLLSASFLSCAEGGEDEDDRSGAYSPVDDDDSAGPVDDADGSDDDESDNDDDTESSDDDVDDDYEQMKCQDLVECVVPYENMTISSNTLFCSGEYTVLSGIMIAGNEFIVCGNNTTLIGDGAQDIFMSMLAIGVNSKRIDIMNILIENSGIGVFGESLADIRLSDIIINGSYNRHVDISGENILIENSSFNDSLNSGVFLGGINGEIRNCTSTNKVDGVVESNFVIQGSGQVLKENIVETRNSSGCNVLWVNECINCVVEDNYVETDYKAASHIKNSENLTFRRNILLSPKVNPTGGHNIQIEEGSVENIFYDNEFYYGEVIDDSEGNLWCFEGAGNYYYEGSFYSGPDPNNGTCDYGGGG